jgi:hypothetical protein
MNPAPYAAAPTGATVVPSSRSRFIRICFGIIQIAMYSTPIIAVPPMSPPSIETPMFMLVLS